MSDRCFGEAADRLYGFAAALLGWRPGEFWSATPAELASALGGSQAAVEGLDAATIDELRQRFPDQ